MEGRMALYQSSDGGGSPFETKLEYPDDGTDWRQNAWLTLTIRYRLNFVDGYNDKAGLIVETDDNRFIALDSDKKSFPIVEWDQGATMRFKNDFQRGEKIWNFRFALIAPQDFDALDFKTLDNNSIVRPNVLCLFRLVADNAKPHLSIDVVRLDPSINSKSFRSCKTVYDNMDLYCPTFGHELGHALGLGHIKELLGDSICIANAQLGIYPNRCYGETEVEKRNIMGSGTEMSLINAQPWKTEIERITSKTWVATLDTNVPPRKLVVGSATGAKPYRF
jgi:hypothetical protein